VESTFASNDRSGPTSPTGTASLGLLLPQAPPGAEEGAGAVPEAGLADAATGTARPAPIEAAAATIKAPPPLDCSTAGASATALAAPSSQGVGSTDVGCRVAGPAPAAETACWIGATPDPMSVESPDLASPSDAAAAAEDPLGPTRATVPSPSAAGSTLAAARAEDTSTVSVEATSLREAVPPTSTAAARPISAASLT
jgi:hypothetical protein